MKPDSKASRILAAFRAGATTVADVEVDLYFELTRHNIAGHVQGLITRGYLERTGAEAKPEGRRGGPAHVYRVTGKL